MGWKTFKERFGITKHIVTVVDGQIHVGSGFVGDLLVVDMKSGEIRENKTFKGFLADCVPALQAASRAEILDAIHAADQFAQSIPVYTFRGAEIIEEMCEAPGWPNITHQGNLMYENRHSTYKDFVIRMAKRSAVANRDHSLELLEKAQKELLRCQALLVEDEAIVRSLEAQFPEEIPANPAR